MVKTKYWVMLLAAIVLVSGIGSFFLLAPQQDASRAQILSGGRVLQTVDLSIDRELTIETENGGRNVVTVKDGKIAVTEANCPDHYCMARGYCAGGTQIVCLPNRLVIEFLGEQEVDGMVG